MSVAPSFVNFTKLSEPFEQNGKMYIKVQNPSTKTIRTVRWYEEKSAETAKEVTTFNQKKALGFDKGYITLFKGENSDNVEWFQMTKECRYSTLWGWYVVSTEEVPEDLPFGVSSVKLEWDAVKDSKTENVLNSNKEIIKQAVDALMFEPSNSEYVGKVGERLDLAASVVKVFELEDKFGRGGTFLHVFIDDDENEYVWTTSSKKLNENTKYSFRGTIKEHKIYKNKKQTILTRCMKIEEMKGEDND